MTLQLALFESPSGAMLADVSGRAGDVVLSTNEHGVEAIRARVDTLLVDAFRFYDQPSLIHVALSDGAMDIGAGRLEDPAVTSADRSQVINALGYWRALYDLENAYTALWSDDSVARWDQVSEDDAANRTPKLYAMDTDNRLFIGLTHNTTYRSGQDIGSLTYETPSPGTGARLLLGVSFDYSVLLPLNWIARLVLRGRDYSGGTVVWTLTGTGALLSGCINTTFAGDNRLELQVFNNTGANATFAGENGTNYAKLTNIRITTSNTNRVNTTLGTAIAAGTRTVTPASMSNIYVGQRLQIANGTAVGESVVVTAITATTFTAIFANAHVAADTVAALVVYTDEIAKDILSTIATLNPGQLNPSTALIQSPGLDISNALFEDKTAADVLISLAARGDASNQLYEVGVTDQRLLYFRPRGSVARAWVVDATSLEIERSLEELVNSTYATYQDANGRTLRTSTTDDTASSGRYGVARRISVAATTTSNKLATTEQTTYLLDHANPLPRAKISFGAIYDAGGGRWPLYLVRAGDTLSIRNLPPTLSTSIDRIRTFHITHTEYRVDSDTLEIEVEASLPTTVTTIVQAAQKKVRGG